MHHNQTTEKVANHQWVTLNQRQLTQVTGGRADTTQTTPNYTVNNPSENLIRKYEQWHAYADSYLTKGAME